MTQPKQPTSNPSHLAIAGRSIRGAREYQEDAYAVWVGARALSGLERGGVEQVALGLADAPGLADAGGHLLALLADGMGGHAGGAVASRLACDAFAQNLHAALLSPVRVERDVVTEPPTLAPRDVAYPTHAVPIPSVPEALRLALTAANDALFDRADSEPALEGMGTTIIGVVVDGEGLRWISVGDSPLYLLRAGDLVQLNADHSLAPVLDAMVAGGEMTRERAMAHPQRHHLRAALTGEELDLIDASEHPLALQTGDVLLLASDGVQSLSHEAIASALAPASKEGPDAALDGLFAAIERAGVPHQDNATAICLVVT
ncbi:MAG: protein phosphatase 2C domain-containing protein [Pseudomonadota bacterium]